MAYKVTINADHLYVQYLGDIDPLDIINITADPEMIVPLQKVGAVIYDFSGARSVNIDLDEMSEIAVLSDLDTPAVARPKGIVIPIDINDTIRIEGLKQALKRMKWEIYFVANHKEALGLL